MDYDDNDFHNQNLHLTGEGSTKFPPVLRPYAVPKFDFDESLQGHLRFDSLVETEVFLDIESNEDNQWIDAYSRGSSGVEFSSTVAESCSISRHNNVWSEATSSESVEMLLKSVGQEELIPREAVIRESDACDELACLAKQMEPNFKPYEKNEFKDNGTDLQQPSCILANLSGSKEDVEMEQSLAGVSQGHEAESSIDGSLNSLEPPDMHRNVDLPESSGILFSDGKCDDDTNQGKVETPADSSLGKKTKNDSTAFEGKINITAASTQNISSNCEVLNIENVQNQIVGMGDEEQSSLLRQTNNKVLESSVIDKDSNVGTEILDVNAVGGEAHHSGRPLCLIRMEEALECGGVIEGKSENTVSSGISNQQKAGRGNEDTCLSDLSQDNASKDAVLIKDPVMDDQSALNTSDIATIVIKDGSSSDEPKVEVSNSGFGTCPNYQLNVVMIEKTLGESSASKEELLDIGNRMDTEVLLSKSEASVFEAVDKNTSTVSERNSDSIASSLFSSNTVVSTKSCILGETTQLCENNEPDKQGDHKIVSQDISVTDQENKKAPFNSSPIHCDVDQSHHVDRGVYSLSLGAGCMETKWTIPTISVDAMPVNNSGHDDIQSMKLVGSASVDEKELKEDSEAKMAEEEVVSLPVGSSELEVDPCPATGTEKQNFSDSSSQNLGTNAAENNSEPHKTQRDNKVDQECTKEVGVVAVLCESLEKHGDEVTFSFIKDDKEAIQEHRDKTCSKLSGSVSSSLPDCRNEYHGTGSCPANPTDNTCGPSIMYGSPPEPQKDENQVKPTANLNPPVSEFMNKDATNTLSCDHGHKGNGVSKDERNLTAEVNLVTSSSKKDVTDLATIETNAGERDSFPVTEANKESTVVEESLLASGLGTPKTNVAGHVSCGSPQIPDGGLAHNVSKGTPERKTRRASNKTPRKESSRKGSKGKTPARQSEKGDRSTSVSLSPSPGFQLVRPNEVQQYGQIDSISTKPFTLFNASTSTSSLPDLNTSASPPVLFQQPFMDIQQVQLRAQIFVYGALIQGTVPDEAHMVSAFGGPDGGRGIWEKAWSSCMERQCVQKAHPINTETPLQSRSGPRTPDLAVKHSATQGKGISSPPCLASSKSTPTIANSVIPLSSPLWSLPTPSRDSLQSSSLARGSALDYSQALTPLHPYQTPPVRNFLGNNTSWMSQAPLRGPWIASSTPSLDSSSHLSASPVADSIKSSSVKVSSVPFSSGIKFVPVLPVSSAGLQSPLIDRNIATASHAQHSVDPKPKKRKKVTMPDDLDQKVMHLQSHLVATPVVSSHASTVVTPSTPGNMPITTVVTTSSAGLQSPLIDRNNATSSHAQHSSDPKPRKRKKVTVSVSDDLGQKTMHLQSHLVSTLAVSSHASTVATTSTPGNVPITVTTSSAGLQKPLIDTNNATASLAQHSSDPKPRKRKKVTVPDDLGQKVMHLQSQLVSTPAVNSHASTVVTISTPGNMPITTVEKSVVSVSSLSLADCLKSDRNVEKRIMSDESLTKIEEARINAEEASALSAAAVNHSLEIWKQLDKQKNSGLASDVEAKLASAAVAVAAAASVAKAAAAAANVAANAALQAKLMVEEALVFSGHENSCQISLSEGMSNMGKATPASILKGAYGTNNSISIIGAAKEAARKRVEAASAASKRAENMAAIVKAAELAAEAVSQAGKIVTMGDPLPLSDLVVAGPEGCWKTVQESSQQVGLLNGMPRGLMNADNVGDRPETSQKRNIHISSEEMGKQIAASEESPFHTVHNEMSLDHTRSIDHISPIININENSSSGSKGCRVSDLVNPIDVLPESGAETQASFTVGNGSENLKENNIQVGSYVEVFKDGEGFKAAWFTANILSLEEDKAYVCYSVLVADEGSGPLKEWMSLEGEGDKPPRIRAARPHAGLHNEGTRKRRRAATVDYTWSVGDRVDAWIHECWQEGVITDKNRKDKTFTVHFPASGETSVAGAWHLRSSLIWKDGKWIESPKVGANDSPNSKGDTPHEKRPKLGNTAEGLVKGNDKISKGADAVGSVNPSESRLLNLTENDKVFNIGKNSQNENKPEAHRLVRSGLQKEGPRVVFGVPKPGKKKKFMEVSKHYVADGTSKIKDGNDSVKLADFLIPKGSGSLGWKNSSRKDIKEKLGADFKPTSKSVKPQSLLGRMIPPKGKPFLNSHNNDPTSRTERIKDSPSHSNNASQSESQPERSSNSETSVAGAGPILYSSRASSTDSHPTKKPPLPRVRKGKLAPAGGRLGKVEVEKASNRNQMKSTSDEVNEPRRSNRRIQPTSRLLEGLQSSLIISKIPSGSHEKGHKSQSRNTSRG